MTFNDYYMVLTDFDMKVKVSDSRYWPPLFTALQYTFHSAINTSHNKFDVIVLLQQEYEVPIAMKAVFDYIDTFSSRIKEMEQQKKQGLICKSEDKSRSLENFLSRYWPFCLFISKWWF